MNYHKIWVVLTDVAGKPVIINKQGSYLLRNAENSHLSDAMELQHGIDVGQKPPRLLKGNIDGVPVAHITMGRNSIDLMKADTKCSYDQKRQLHEAFLHTMNPETKPAFELYLQEKEGK